MRLPCSPPSYDYINVTNSLTHQEFIMKVKPKATNEDILHMVHQITSIPRDEFMFVDHRGHMWLYPNSRPTTSAVMITRPYPRGGMNRERSRSRDSPNMRDVSPTRPLSPTVPFYESSSSTPGGPDLHDVHEPEPEFGVLQYHADRREEHERLRGMRPISLEYMPHEEPRTRALQTAGLELEHDDPAAQAPPPRPPLSLLRDNPENDLPVNSIVFSAAWPESPPPAQPRRVARPILCNNERVGTVYAAEGALVWQVMNDVQDHIRTWSPPWSMPMATRYWREVASIHCLFLEL